jgi:IclR family KDG regulon transcriptional repressor
MVGGEMRATVLPKRRRWIKRDTAIDSSKSLQKALRILIHMGHHGPDAGVTQLASALGLNKATVYRLLSTMEKFGLLERNEDTERYRLGLALHQLGMKAIESRTLRGESHRLLLEMAKRSQESVSLAVPSAMGVICLDRVDPPNSVITVRTPVGARFPAHCTASGKAVLAYMPEDAIEDILRTNGLMRYTPFTRTKMGDVRQELERTRQRGYAVDGQELERGLSGVAAPVFGSNRQIQAAVGIAGPTMRFRGKELADKIGLAREIAIRLSVSLGGEDSGIPWFSDEGPRSVKP